MRKHNLDFGVPVGREQWEQLGRTAAALSPSASGLVWRGDEWSTIRVFLRRNDVPGELRELVNERDWAGMLEREVAQFLYNAGRPFARVLPIDAPDEPAISEGEEQRMRQALDRWVRLKWRHLMEASGLHYDRGGTTPSDVGEVPDSGMEDPGRPH